MKLKRKRLLKVFLSMLLIISFLSQSVVSFALPNASTGNSGDGDKKYNTDKDVGENMFNSRVGWLMSVQEADSVANNSDYSDCAVAIVNKYLYDYPKEYVYDYYTNPEKFTYVEWTNTNTHHTSSGGYKITKQRRPRSSQGNINNKSFANSYSSNAAAGTGFIHAHQSDFDNNLKPTFHSAAQLLDSNTSIKQGLMDRSLTGSHAISVATSTGKLDAAIKSYVALWALSGSADDAINEFIYGNSSETLDHYDILVRYLDFLIIINAMCNNAYNSYIDDFCMYQNDNYASKYVTVTIASAIAVSASKSTSYCIITLPNYYAVRSKSSVESLLHWGGTGNGNIYDATTVTSSWSDLQNFYKTNAPDRNGSNTYAKDGNADRYWWSQATEDWGMALTAFPKGLGGNLCGNAGYTYISTQNIDSVTVIKPPTTTTPGPTPLKLDFNISVSSDQYMITSDKETVDAVVTIGFKQTEANLRNLKLLYDSLKADTSEDWETALEVIVQRTFEYDDEKGGVNTAAWDTTDKIFDVNLNSNFKNAATLDNYNDTVIFRWEGVNWNDSTSMNAYSVFTGQQQIQFEDKGIYIDMTEKAVTNATYHCVVRFTYYPKSYTSEQKVNRPTFTYNVNGTGKTKCSHYKYELNGKEKEKGCEDKWRWHRGEDTFKAGSSGSAAHDSAPWIYRGDAVLFYSSINPGNYAEVKHNSIYSEQYEAMAGVPTDENLFLGVGYTEFMVNMEGDIKKDTGKTRTYTLRYVVDKCKGSNKTACTRYCPGHTFTCSKDSSHTESAGNCNGSSISSKTCTKCDGDSKGTMSVSFDIEAKCPGETAKLEGATAAATAAAGCKVKHYLNENHTHVHTYEAKITQEIADYHYLDIDDNLEVWQVNEIEYKVNGDLISNGNQKIKPATTVRAFYKKGAYSSGEGRLIFSKAKSDKGYLGDDKWEIHTGETTALVTAAPEPFVKYLNSYINNTVNGTTVTVMSDYLDLKNTDGTYQVITGNTYVSRAAEIAEANYKEFVESEKTDSDGKESVDNKTYMFNPSTGEPSLSYKKGSKEGLNFVSASSSESPWGDSLEDARKSMWTGEGTKPNSLTSQSFYKYDSEDLYRVGYTGEYANRASNYSNIKHGTRSDPLLDKNVFGSSATYADRLGSSLVDKSEIGSGTGQAAYEVKGLNIRDSYEKKTGADSNIYRPNEISDNKAPIENGVHGVGSVYLHAKKSIGDIHGTKGINWGTADGNKIKMEGTTVEEDNKSYDIEMVYTEGKTKVNDIVVFDPVATAGEVLSIDEKYDMRVDGSAPKGIRPALSTGTCPGDYTCEYKTLADYDAHPKDADGNVFTQHTDSCYVQVSGDYYQHLQDDGSQGPKGAYNYHEHDDDGCYSNYKKTLEVDKSKIALKETDTNKMSVTGKYLLAGGSTYYIEIAGPSSGHYKYNRYRDKSSYQDYLNYPGTVIKGFITLEGDPNSEDDVYTLDYTTSLMGMNSSDLQWANKELKDAMKKAVRGTQKVEITVPKLSSDSVSNVKATRNAMVEAKTDTAVKITNKSGTEVLNVTAARGRGTPVPNWFRDALEPYESKVTGTIKNQLLSYDNNGDGYIKIVAVSDERYGDKYGQYSVEDALYNPELAYDSKKVEPYTHGMYLWNWNLNLYNDKPTSSTSLSGFRYFFHCSSADADSTYHYPLSESQEFINGSKNYHYEPFVYGWLNDYELFGEDDEVDADGEEVEDPNEEETSSTEESEEEESGTEESSTETSSEDTPETGDGSDVAIDDENYNSQSSSKDTVDLKFYHINDKGKVADLNSGKDRIAKVQLLYNLNFYTYDSSKSKYVQAKFVSDNGRTKNATMKELGYKALQDSKYDNFYVRLGFGAKDYMLFSEFVETYKSSLYMKVLPIDSVSWGTRKNITKSDYFCRHVRGRLYYTERDSRFYYDGNALFDWNEDHTEPNRHACTSACTGYKGAKVLSCTEPHHYTEKSLMGAWASYLPAGVSIDSCTDAQKKEALQKYFRESPYYDDASHHSTECWVPCGDDGKHTLSAEAKKAEYEKAVSENGNTIKVRRQHIAFVGLDREFKVKFPTTGDFYGSNAFGILDTVGVLGKGYANGMSTERWIRDKYVTFSFDVLVQNPDYSGGVIDELGPYTAYAAGTPIPWYTYFKGRNEGTFYIPLENSEQIDGTAQFQVIAVNGVREGISKENEKEDNHASETYNYRRDHDAYLLQYVDVIGSMGALSIADSGDPRFAALFKKVSTAGDTTDNVNYSTDLNDWLIPGLVPAVDSESPKKIVSDQKTAKNEDSRASHYQDSWLTLTPGETSDGSYKNGSNVPEHPITEFGGKWKDSLEFPLTPEYLRDISPGLTNQAMRIGYGLYMDVQTVGNYYGRNYGEETKQQVAIKPNYTLVVPRAADGSTDPKEVTSFNMYDLDVYAANSMGEYSLVNYYSDLGGSADEGRNLKPGNVYLDWMTESGRRNATKYESYVTGLGDKQFVTITDESLITQDPDTGELVIPDAAYSVSGRSVTASEMHKIGTTQLLNLVDLDKTYLGTMHTADRAGAGSFTKSTLMNGNIGDEEGNAAADTYLVPVTYTKQAQRYHFTIKLPSSSKFVLKGRAYNNANLKEYDELASVEGAHIILTLDIQANGQVWDLEYKGVPAKYTYKGYKFDPGRDPDPDPRPDPDPGHDPEDPPVPIVIYDPKKTSKDDLDTYGTH